MATKVKERTTRQQQEVVVQGVVETAAPGVTAEDIKAYYEAQVQAMLDQALSAVQPEAAEPFDWWDLFSIGVIQNVAGDFGIAPVGPFLPHEVVRVNEQAFIVTVLILNPLPIGSPPGLVPCNVLSGTALPFEIQYSSLNTTTGTPAAFASGVNTGQLQPGVCFYVDVFEFVATEEGCIIETNVCARILNCEGQTPPQWPFAGFATWILNIDNESFLAGLLGVGPSKPAFIPNAPIRFMTFDT